ncbi:unnamed protein product, partial [marine sediment metagenome]
ALFVGKALDHKPTIFEVNRDKSDRTGKDYPYPSLDTPSQTSVFLSSEYPLSAVLHRQALPHK